MTEPHVHAVREWMATETEYAKLYMERDLLLWLHAEAVWRIEGLRAWAHAQSRDRDRWLASWQRSVREHEVAQSDSHGEINALKIEVADLQQQRAVLPEPVQRLVAWHLSVAGTNVARMPLQSEVREAMESWRPATVEAAPPAGIALADELWPVPLADLTEAKFKEFHEGALSARPAPSAAVDRDALAALFRAAPGRVRLGDQTPGEIARRLLARYDIRERGEAQAQPDGAALIAAERRRQVEVEGWTAEHDDDVGRHGKLARAAAVYATPLPDRDPDFVQQFWPWEQPSFYKPTPLDRVRELTKAGALIAAEIDRLHRAAGAP